jgi:uncharacterized protein with ACT and thioredoxin-like domain
MRKYVTISGTTLLASGPTEAFSELEKLITEGRVTAGNLPLTGQKKKYGERLIVRRYTPGVLVLSLSVQGGQISNA